MYQLPQAVLGRIYEYDPTYRIHEHKKQMVALLETNDYEHEWAHLDFMDSYGFHFIMFWASAVYLVFVLPVYAVICACQLFFIVTAAVAYIPYRIVYPRP